MPTNKLLIITDKLGLHVRPAWALVKLFSKYRSQITICKDKRIANGKSILEILSLGAGAGSTLILTVEGDDAPQVMDEISSLIDAGFAL